MKKQTKRKQQIKGKKLAKKQLANTSPTKYSEKEMKKQVGCVMLDLREERGKNAEQLK